VTRLPTLDAVVEDLLLYPPGSAEFEDALRKSSKCDREEALREIRLRRFWLEQRQDEIRRRLNYLNDEFGLG
jgi:hypothetical protein